MLAQAARGKVNIREYSIVAGVINIAFIISSLKVLVLAVTSDKHQGYIFSKSSKVRLNHTPLQAKTVILIWLLSSLFIIFDVLTIIASLISLGITYYFFIFLRYESLSRGFGAPGYFLTFTNLTSFGLQFTQQYQPTNLNLLVSLIGFEIGTIFLISGIYKCSSGYLHDQGINIGLINPMWGFKPEQWGSFTPGKTRTKLINLVSIIGEVIGGILLMSIKYRLVGAIIISLMFVGVMFMVRLGPLCPAIIFVTLGPNLIVSQNIQGSSYLVNPKYFTFAALLLQLIIVLVYIGISINFYMKKDLPALAQKIVNFFQEIFGISLWRVFTSDITSIYIRIFSLDADGNRIELSEWNRRRNRRFNFVGEAISVTSIFTLLKYQKSHKLFHSRLISYAKTLRHDSIEFEYYYIGLNPDNISVRHVRSYVVNSNMQDVVEIKIDPTFDPTAPEIHSRVSAAKQYGHYN